MKHQAGLSRRELLKKLSAGTASITAIGRLSSSTVGSSLLTQEPIKPAVKARVVPFDLADVRLLDGPFRQAQQRDARYLLKLEPDRLLHNFRVNAGLKPKAPVYGGWESVEPWIGIRCHGHTLGHYLSACSMMFAATGNQSFKQRVDYLVSELQECQAAGKTGLICAFPDGSAPLDSIRHATTFVGVPWYTMHKIFAGLRDAYLYAGNRMALEVLRTLSDWAIAHTQALTDDQFQLMLNTEHGGMNEVLADVYALTGETRYLSLAIRFCHRALLDPLAREQDTLDGLHSNTQIPKVIGFNRIYELNGEGKYGAAARFFWQTVVGKRSFVTGGNGDGEHFFPPTDFLQHLGSAKTMETCCTHNMLKLTRSLFALEPSVPYADYYERALYNSILASQDPDSGMMTYFQSTRPGYLKLYCTPFDSFWCCTGSGMENHAKYGDSIYFHDAESLFVNLFIPSTLHWKEKGLKITQTNRFPDEQQTRLRFSSHGPLKLKLNIRHPNWCKEMTITINGRRTVNSQTPGSYVAVERVWHDGDSVEVQLPMTLRVEDLPGRPELVALLYGPIVLAGRLGQKGLTAGSDLIVNERTIGDVLKDSVEVPWLAGDADHIVTRVRRLPGPTLTFQTQGLGQPHDVSLIPYYRIAHERYTIYWQTRT
jgi:DUF1680 family protein